MKTDDLFNLAEPDHYWLEAISKDTIILRQLAVTQASDLIEDIHTITQKSPFRHLKTPGGHNMSVAISHCGRYGWHSDQRGYRYESHDPATQQAWPDLPASFRQLAKEASQIAGYKNFRIDTALINRYEPKAKMSLHQDKDEKDFSAPIISVSLGVPATFLWGGKKRSDKAQRIPLIHGDVVVWGGAERLNFHGILPLKTDYHPLTGHYRFNITFRTVT